MLQNRIALYVTASERKKDKISGAHTPGMHQHVTGKQPLEPNPSLALHNILQTLK